MADKCVVCSREAAEVRCQECNSWLHRACISMRTTRHGERVVCDQCQQEAAVFADAEESNITMVDAIRANALTSTQIASVSNNHDNVSTAREVLLEEQIKQMKQMIETLHSGLANITASLAERTSATSPQNGSIDEVALSRSEATVNRSQAAILKSIRTEPLDKSQRQYRQRDFELPAFNGEPTSWFYFKSSFDESTLTCGLSLVENLKRLNKVLSGAARECVKHLLNFPQNVDEIMELLEDNFGSPSVMLNTATRRADRLESLKNDLSNVQEFYGKVQQIHHLLSMVDDCPDERSLVKVLQRKIPLANAREWFRIIGQKEATVTLFREYIQSICKDVGRLHNYEDDPVPADTSRRSQSKKHHVLFHENQHPSPTPSDDKCILKCVDDHALSECPQFVKMPVKLRWNLVKSRNRCTACFGKHWESKCTAKVKCPVPECTRMHHKLLHADVDNKFMGTSKPVTRSEVIGVCSASSGSSGTQHRVVPVILSAGEKNIPVYALMDNGSSVTLIDTKLARALGLKSSPERMKVTWMDGIIHDKQTEKVKFTINSNDGKFSGHIEAMTADNLRLPCHSTNQELLSQEAFEGLPIECFNDATPRLLIGLDNTRVTVTLDWRKGNSNRLFAIKTALGWTLEGKYKLDAETCLFINNDDERLHRLVKEYIEADSFGLVPDNDIKVESDENIRARRLMSELTIEVNGRYETGLLWRVDDVVLPDNREMAWRRHVSFNKKLKRDVNLWEKLSELMKRYAQKNYINVVPPGEVRKDRTWYLPIFSVRNPSKPDKVRIVWDAAATYEDISLNSTLVVGPDMTAPLIHVLMRFRRFPVAFGADIEEMFHQVRMRKEDRCAQRFFWKGIDDHSTTEYEMAVMTFGAACSPSCTSHKNTNASRFIHENPAAVDAIINQHYVDDWLQSCRSVEEAISLAEAVRTIHQRGGFHIHKWVSNSEQFMMAIDPISFAHRKKVSLISNDTVLGLQWNSIDDYLSFRWRADKFGDLTTMEKDTMPTKRELLKIAMSVYDPLGLISYLTVLPRIILRDVWRMDTGWDENVSTEFSKQWRDWLKALQTMHSIQIPRWYGITVDDVDLHIFVDASENALAAAAYVVSRRSDGTTRSLIMAKCKVTPTKAKSIPRLELDAALVGVRLRSMVVEANCWTYNRTVMWSDAKDVLYWLRSHKRKYSSYVANRVGEILRHTPVEYWRWVPSVLNPADWATKWSIHEPGADLWWHGPQFLDEEEEQWPNAFDEPTPILEVKHVLHLKVEELHPLIPPVKNFSTWDALVRNTACAFTFVEIVKRQRKRGSITEDELNQAKLEIIRDVQKTLPSLQGKAMAKFSPFKDENGIVRMRGRTERAAHLSYDAKYPVIIPSNNYVTSLIIDHFHRFNGHCHTNRTINELRQSFVLPHPRREVNRVIRECKHCHLISAIPIIPRMANLPSARVSAGNRPFTHTGVDYFGPMDVRIGRRHEKRWGVLFTCLSTRAIYLELAYSLSAQSCITALDSLVARRGMPREIRSDNGKNFVAASRLFRGPNGYRPKWRFNPPMTPHMGGSWERLIGVTKKVLTSLRLERTPTEERLRWFLSQAERLVNSRPLTDIIVDASSEEALTPNHFLLGTSSGLKDGDDQLRDATPEDLVCQEEELRHFWQRWTKEYLPTISFKEKWHETKYVAQIGDVVYICDDNHRYGWRKGRIVEVISSLEDGQVRQVVVQTADGRRYRRGTARVAPICRSNNWTEKKDNPTDQPANDDRFSWRGGDCRENLSKPVISKPVPIKGQVNTYSASIPVNITQ